MFKLSKKSLDVLSTVHVDLQQIVKKAITISEIDFGVTEGIRTISQQMTYVKKGVSKTYNSYHLHGHAIDLFAWVDNKVNWSPKYYHKINTAMQSAANDLNIKLTWGGNFKSFFDGCHWQIEGYTKNNNVISELKKLGLIK